MARSTEQIRDAIKSSIAAINSTLDLVVGPLWDYLIAPVPAQLSTIESAIDNLKVFYSPNFAAVATPQEARDFAVNFGTGPSSGNFSRCNIVFYRNSPPPAGKTFTIQIGSLISTADFTLVFRTLQTVVMSGDYAATYFNPSTQRYEVGVTVESVAPGSTYNIPAGHLVKMQPTIPGIDGVVQVTAATGGTEPETSLDVAQRVQTKFQGLDVNSQGGIVSKIKEFAPTMAKAIAVIKPTSRTEFRRLTSGPALDVYVQGNNNIQFIEEYLTLGGESVIPIATNTTVVSVSSVAVDGNVLLSSQWLFVPDVSLEYRASTKAAPSVALVPAPADGSPAIALSANSVVEITGTKNYLLDGVQSLFLGDNAFFKTDVLVRSFIDLPIIVSLDVRINDGDVDTLTAQITAMLVNFIQPTSGGIPQILLPDSVTGILLTLPEVSTIKILAFRRQIGSISSVETIIPLKNQIPVFNTVASTITVRL